MVQRPLPLHELTNHNEGVVDVDATETVGGFANVCPRIVRLHLLDLQAHAEDSESDPAAVDVASVLGPHDERWGVSLHGAGQLHGAANSG